MLRYYFEKTENDHSFLFNNLAIAKQEDEYISHMGQYPVISYFDSQEAFYHGFLLGVLSNIQGYIIKSNKESGTGRLDIFMKNKGIRKRAMIFELKIAKDEDDPEKICNEALEQIEKKRYAYFSK